MLEPVYEQGAKPPYQLQMWGYETGSVFPFWIPIQWVSSIEEAEQIVNKVSLPIPIPNRYQFRLYMGRDYGYQEILCKEENHEQSRQ